MSKPLLSTFLLWAVLTALSARSSAQTDEDKDPIIVRLATEQQLMPLYLAKFMDEHSGLTPSALVELEKTLEFDLNHNGMTQTVKHNGQKDTLATQGGFDGPGNSDEWKKLNVFYVIKVRIRDKQMDARVFSVSSNTIKSVEGLALTGDPSQDRRQIHQLADMVHKALFGTDGIASTHILYTLKTRSDKENKWVSELWEADYDGANARKVLQEDSGYNVTPAYIPPKPGYKSAGILYVSYQNGQPKIYIAGLREGIGRRFSYLRGNQLMPAISRQRDKAAFICDITGNPDLFLQEFSAEAGAVGKPRQIYTTHQATQGTPAFSPDGTQIAFVSNKDGSPRIYVMDIPPEGMKLKDIKAKLITKANRESTAPCWSADGKKLAYCAKTDGVRQIWIYDFETGEETQLTRGAGNKENPVWAPNSLHIVFNSTGKDASELYLINLNQPDATRITGGPGEKRFPSWEPR